MERVYVKVRDHYILFLFDKEKKKWVGSCQVGEKIYVSNNINFDGIEIADPKYILDIYTNKIYNSRIEFDENLMTIYTEIAAFNRFIIVELHEKPILNIGTDLIKNMQYSIKYITEKVIDNEEKILNFDKEIIEINDNICEFKEIIDQDQTQAEKNTNNIQKLKKLYKSLNEKVVSLEYSSQPAAQKSKKIDIKIIYTKNEGIKLMSEDNFELFLNKIWTKFSQIKVKFITDNEITCAQSDDESDNVIGTFADIYSNLPDMFEDKNLWAQSEINFQFSTRTQDKEYDIELHLYDSDLKDTVRLNSFRFGASVKAIINYLTSNEDSFKSTLFKKNGSIQIGYLSINRVPLKKIMVSDSWSSIGYDMYREEKIKQDGKVIGYYLSN